MNKDFIIYVAPEGTPGCDPEGHNACDGLSPEFGSGTSGPAPNLDAAIRIARAYRAMGRFHGLATIRMLPGDHYLRRPLELTPSDNGGLRIESAQRSDPATIWGGQRVQNWEMQEHQGMPLWVTDVSKHLLAHGAFKSLWVEGKLAPRPRWPKKSADNLRMAEVIGRGTEVDLHRGSDRFVFQHQDVPESLLEDFDGVDVCVPHFWIEERMPIEHIDKETNEIISTHCSRFCLTDSYSGEWARYYFDNLGSALSEAGEWFLDRKRQRLYYLPKEGETPENTRIIIPVLRQFFRLRGDKGSIPVEGIEIHGLNFCATDWDMSEDENLRITPTLTGTRHEERPQLPHETVVKPIDKPWASAMQAAYNTPACIELAWARNCALTNNRFEGIAQYAIRLNEGCNTITLSGNELSYLGAGGIVVDGGSIDETPDTHNQHIFIDRNQIHHGGYVFPGACGILITHASRVRIADNHIHHHTYSGISAGWTWGFADTVNSEIRIERNHIHHLGERAGMSDMGGIYMLGKTPAGLVRENIIHNVVCARYGGVGIYADQGASLITFENNLIFNIQETCVLEHWSRSNLYRGNIFAFSKEETVGLIFLCGENNQRFWDYPEQCVRFENNLFIAKGTAVYAATMDFNNQAKLFTQKNTYWDTERKEDLVYMRNGHWESPPWQIPFSASEEASNGTGSSLTASALVDPENGDFRRIGMTHDQMPFIRLNEGIIEKESTKRGIQGESEGVIP